MDQEVRKFALKCAIAGFTFFVTITFSAHFAGLMIQWRAMEIADIAIGQVMSGIKGQFNHVSSRIIDSTDTVLAEQADPSTDLAPEKKERMLRNLKIVADRWRPFAQQLSTP